MKSLREKILNFNCPVILYELLPPPLNNNSSVDAYIDCAIDLLTSSSIPIDAINIPEIRDENNKKRKLESKLDAFSFATTLETSMYKHVDVILNHCTVYEPFTEQIKWLTTANQHNKLQFLILVGGSSSKVVYPGPSVLDMARYIQNHYKEQLFCGGITIQSRRYHEQNKDEPNRLILKGKYGLQFFTSQIIYDAISVKFLLRDYAQACYETGISPKRIFLSFAPIANMKDLQFLQWLGVHVPKTIQNELFKADIGIGWRSAKIAENILQEILAFMQYENIEIPLGLNIEHITRHNFEISLNLIQRLGSLYQNYQQIYCKRHT